MTNEDENTASASEAGSEAGTSRKRTRPRKVDVQGLRRKLLDTCDRYLTDTELPDLSASMVKAIADVVTTVGPEFAKHDLATQEREQRERIGAFSMPFEVPVGGEFPPAPVESLPGDSSTGFPSVPVPTVRTGGGGIKQPPARRSPPPLPFNPDDYSGLQPASN